MRFLTMVSQAVEWKLLLPASDDDGDTYHWEYGAEVYDGQTLTVNLEAGHNQTFKCVATDSYGADDSSDQLCILIQSPMISTAEDVVSDGEDSTQWIWR